MGVALKHLNESDRISIARSLFKVTAEDKHKGEMHGLCPIHNEKNPSFSYNYKSDVFGCFSCGAGGDLIALWTQFNDHDTKEGFKSFCTQYGVPLANTGNNTEAGVDPPAPADVVRLRSKLVRELAGGNCMESVAAKARPKDRWLSTEIVARKLGCSRSQVYNLIRDGRLPAHNLGVRMTRIWKSDFERFMEESRIDPQNYYE